MRDHEIELIVALVQGDLEDESEARALIASGADFEEEYEAQKLAYEALSNVGSAMLSETERATLHRDLWTELRTGGPAAPARTTSPWYYRWAGVAAGMFVVVGLVAVLNQGGSGDDAGAEAFTGTTSADSAEPVEATDSTEAAAEAPPAEEDSAVTAADFLSGEFSRSLSEEDIAFYAAQAEKLRVGEDGALDEEASRDDPLQTCVDASGLEGFRVVAAGPPYETDTTIELPEDATPYIVAIPESSDLTDAPIAFVDLFSCEIIHVDQ